MESNVRESRHRTVENETPELRESFEGHSGGLSYRVLHVDDNPDDRALVARELRRDLPDLIITEVGDEAALDRALAEGAYDLVITDYQLYWGDGLKVVERVRHEAPEVPVVMFTGTGNEEVAVEAMKAGVVDYILKTPRHFERLRATVQQALERGEHSRELARAEARYTELFDTVPVGLFRCTPKGQILDANPALIAMTGHSSRAELLQKSFAELHRDSADFQLWRDKLERDGAVTSVESRFKHGNGQRWVEIHAKALRDAETGEIYYEGSVEDISARKQVEGEREQLIAELRQALGRVKSLTGLLPICSSCKKIRDSGGHWNMLESFIENHSHAHFTHSFCPDCARRLYPEVFLENPKT
jgi:PAS domain S-box-containing protein